MINHGVEHGKNIHFEKNDLTRLVAKCRYKNCKRRILGKKMHNNTDFEIWSMNSKRSCGRNLNQKLVIASLLAVRYSDDFKSERDVDVQEFIAKVRRDLLVDISPSKDYGAKLEALEIIEGRYKDQYKVTMALL